MITLYFDVESDKQSFETSLDFIAFFVVFFTQYKSDYDLTEENSIVKAIELSINAHMFENAILLFATMCDNIHFESEDLTIHRDYTE